MSGPHFKPWDDFCFLDRPRKRIPRWRTLDPITSQGAGVVVGVGLTGEILSTTLTTTQTTTQTTTLTTIGNTWRQEGFNDVWGPLWRHALRAKCCRIRVLLVMTKFIEKECLRIYRIFMFAEGIAIWFYLEVLTLNMQAASSTKRNPYLGVDT